MTDNSHPIFPLDCEMLDQMIECGKWPKAWKRGLLFENPQYTLLWLRLAQATWRMAKLNDHENSEKAQEFEGEAKNLRPDVIYARILLGLDYKLGKVLTPKNQEKFESSLFLKASESGERLNTKRDIRLIFLWVITRGNVDGDWKLCQPSYPVLISRPLPPIQTGNSHRMDLAQEIRSKFTNILNESPKWLEEHQEGSILLSAMLWDGLLEKSAIDSLRNALNRPLVRGVSGNWIDLLLNPDRPAKTKIRRFWPQPITTILWFRYVGKKVNQDSAVELIEKLVNKLLGDRSPKLATLIKGLTQEYSLEINPALLNVATGKTLTHPILGDRWHSIQGVGKPCEDVPILNSPSDTDENKNEDWLGELESEEEPLLKFISPLGMLEIRNALASSNVSEMLKQLKMVVKKEESYSPIIKILAGWIIALPKKTRLSTRRGMFGLIGARLVSLLGEDDIEKYDEDEWEYVFSLVLADAQSNSHMRGMRYSLKRLHGFICDLNPMYRPAILKIEDRIDVSARVITHEEYQQTLEMLSKPIKSGDCENYILTCQIALILFFKLGLRRRELLFLPLHDIHGQENIEILIRPHSERAIKTLNALRTLQLEGFLSKQEAKMVKLWLKKRINHELITPSSIYYFWYPESKAEQVSEKAIVDRIVEILRIVSGDRYLHLHHLRHSFNTWSCLSILGHAEEDNFNQWEHLPQTQAWLRDFRITTDGLYIDKPKRRSLVYLISTLSGHSTPSITFEHYIHCTDSLIGKTIWSVAGMEPSEVSYKATGLARRTFFRHQKMGWDGLINLLAKTYPARWNTGRIISSSEIRAPDREVPSLYDRLFKTCQVLTWRSIKGGTVDIRRFLDEMAIYEEVFEQFRKLIDNGFFQRDAPRLPSGNKHIEQIKSYSSILEEGLYKDKGKSNLDVLINIWINYKFKQRGQLRFTNPETAKHCLEALVEMGLPWKNIDLTWVGSRFTREEGKESRAYWRRALSLSRRISIYSQSIDNDRPLKKSKGYLDIRVGRL